MTSDDLSYLVIRHNWIILAAGIIGLIVRVLKSDTKLPWSVPPQYRVWLALGLGGVAGALNKLANMSDVTWTSALVQGLVAGVTAIIGHETIVESLNGGRDPVIPGLTKPPTDPPSPPSPPPPPAVFADGELVNNEGLPMLNTPIIDSSKPRSIFRGAAIVLLCASFAACALFTPSNLPKTVLTLEQIACIAENAFLDDALLGQMCNLLTVEEIEAARRVARATREGVAKHKAKTDGGACP